MVSEILFFVVCFSVFYPYRLTSSLFISSLAMWDVTLGKPCVRHIISHARCANTVGGLFLVFAKYL